MGPVKKIFHYWNRFRLIINKNYFTRYLKNQGVIIGKNSYVIYPSYIDARLPYLVEIGSNVIISRNVTILTHDAATAFAGDMVKIGKVIIHDHSFIGANSTILCDVEIGPNSIIGAGSVISHDVPPNTIFAGNPARFISDIKVFIERYRELSKHSPFFLGIEYPHPYIKDEKKETLRYGLRNGVGYFCSQLPDKRINGRGAK